MSWRSASTSTSRPAARAASLVIGPIETMRAPRREAVAERLGQVVHGRGGGEGDVVGALGGLDRLGVGLLAHRLVEGDDVDLGAALAQRVGEDVAGLGGAGDEDAARPRPRRPASASTSASATKRSGTTSASDPVLGQRPRGPGPIAATVDAGQRPGVEARRLGQRLEQQADAVGAGQADQRVLADRGRPRRAPRRCRSAARSGSPAARPPRRRGRAGSRRGRWPGRGRG